MPRAIATHGFESPPQEDAYSVPFYQCNRDVQRVFMSRLKVLGLWIVGDGRDMEYVLDILFSIQDQAQ